MQPWKIEYWRSCIETIDMRCSPSRRDYTAHDADGIEHTLTVNAVGNFHADKHTTFSLPYHARVVAAGKTRAMSAAQTDGDCNGCHTEAGAQNAPGRIALPQ